MEHLNEYMLGIFVRDSQKNTRMIRLDEVLIPVVARCWFEEASHVSTDYFASLSASNRWWERKTFSAEIVLCFTDSQTGEIIEWLRRTISVKTLQTDIKVTLDILAEEFAERLPAALTKACERALKLVECEEEQARAKLNQLDELKQHLIKEQRLRLQPS